MNDGYDGLIDRDDFEGNGAGGGVDKTGLLTKDHTITNSDG